MSIWLTVWDGQDSADGKAQIIGVEETLPDAKAVARQHSTRLASDTVQTYSLEEWKVGHDAARDREWVMYRNGEDVPPRPSRTAEAQSDH